MPLKERTVILKAGESLVSKFGRRPPRGLVSHNCADQYRTESEIDCVRTRKSHQAQLVDVSYPTYLIPLRDGESHRRSRWIVHTEPNFITAVGSHPAPTTQSADAAYSAPVTCCYFCRLGMNDPPTAVGGILTRRSYCFRRLSMKHPPTAVGGIFEFSHNLSRSRFCIRVWRHVASSARFFLAVLLILFVAEYIFPSHDMGRPLTLGVIDFGQSITGKLAAERLAANLKATNGWRVLDRDLVRIAAKGAGYSGSLNMSLTEARDLGAALGCDYFILGEADTVRRSPSNGNAYYEAYAAIFLVSARSGRLISWERPGFRSSTQSEAEESLLANLASESFRNRFLLAISRAQEDEVHERELAAEGAAPIIEEAPPDDENAAEQGLRLPRPYRRLRPAYPESAARAEAQGTVDVLVDLDASGEVTRVEVARWAGFGLDQATVDTVHQLHFFPAVRNGTAVPIRVLLRYNFRKPSQ